MSRNNVGERESRSTAGELLFKLTVNMQVKYRNCTCGKIKLRLHTKYLGSLIIQPEFG